jgi:hypothetical protein
MIIEVRGNLRLSLSYVSLRVVKPIVEVAIRLIDQVVVLAIFRQRPIMKHLVMCDLIRNPSWKCVTGPVMPIVRARSAD